MFKRQLFQRTADTAVAGGSTQIMSKGERTQIVDKSGNIMNKIHVGAGWDIASGHNADSYDLDLFAICLDSNNKLADPSNLNHSVAYYANKNLPGIQCGADNLTGAGDGDDENIQLALDAIPANVNAILICMNIYSAASKHNQTFGQVENAFVRYADPADITHDIKKFNLTEDFSTNNAIIAAKIYRADGLWKIQALGQGTNGTIQQIADSYKG